MKTDIYFVRHAQSDISVKDDAIRPLTSRGSVDSKLVTRALRDKNIGRVYSSPYKRAIDTVRDFADSIGVDIETVNDFRERKIYDGWWLDDYASFSRRQWEDFDFRMENGESLGEVRQRNISALFAVLEKDMGTNIAVGTHGTALSTIISYFRPGFGYEDFLAIKDRMPYIVFFKFVGTDFADMEEIAI